MGQVTAVVEKEQAGVTLAALVRQQLPERSWKQVRRLIETRHVRINGELCLDHARRVKEGETVAMLDESAPVPREPERVALRYLDEHLVVVDKPAGISTVRHPSERGWSQQRRALSPTLDDIVLRLVAAEDKRTPIKRLRVVQRIDKATSGLLVFARSVEAERGLGQQFANHTAERRYLAIVAGQPDARTIRSQLVRDRGDGRRGSTNQPGQGKEAVTHIEILERIGAFSLLSCRLETGRTHQIRIHLSELGHALCGEPVYNRQRDGAIIPDASGAPRLALHAAELGFQHPLSGEKVHWKMALPDDLEMFLRRLREQK